MQHTKWLMMGSALFMELIGIIFLFLPDELISHLGCDKQSAFLPLLFQLMAALYIGFAMLNYMARGTLIGGIYSRPVALGNFAHFFIGALILVKTALAAGAPLLVYAATAAYVLFATLFGLVLFSAGLQGQPKAR